MAHHDNERPARRRAIARWAAVALGACILLGLSQALWMWQSWPVRHLLQAPAVAGPAT
jgi:type VI secretion system protein ImpK